MRCISAFFIDIDFYHMGRLGPPHKILTLGTEIKKIDRWTYLKYPLSKQNIQKNVIGGHFITEHNGVTNYI